LTERGKDFHSFRHTVIDDLKQGEVNERVLKALVGHADQLSEDVQKDDITMDRYGKRYKAEILHNMVCRLDYSRVLGGVKGWTIKAI
jgi:integrase